VKVEDCETITHILQLGQSVFYLPTFMNISGGRMWDIF